MMSYKTLCIFLLMMFVLAGCVRVSDHPSVIGSYDNKAESWNSCFDDKGSFLLNRSSSSQQSEPMSLQFSLLTWNSYKGRKEGWHAELERLSKKNDILVLQEGYLTDILQELLEALNFKWNIANAFTYNDIPVGTLTASRVQPVSVCSFNSMEPISGIPKSVLITRYQFSGTDRTLILANLHMINFTLDNSAYRSQLEKIARALKLHDGPFVLAGDFNTWNADRKKILDDFLVEVAAVSVKFPIDKRSRFMGNHVDHIFYNGLELINSFTEEVTCSDHNPLMATFRYREEE